jgi:hypothetical protein
MEAVGGRRTEEDDAPEAKRANRAVLGLASSCGVEGRRSRRRLWGPAPEQRLEIWPADQRNSAGFVSVSWPMEEERKWERRQCRPAGLKKG